MNRDAALKTLGLKRNAPSEEISRAYRRLIRKAHPDVGGDTVVAARITEAYSWLQQAAPTAVSDRGAGAPSAGAPSPGDDKLVLLLSPGDVFARLCDLGQRLGELSYLDPEAEIMQVTFTAVNSVPCQLMATVIPSANPTHAQVEFTLEPLTNGLPPPIAAVICHMFGNQ